MPRADNATNAPPTQVANRGNLRKKNRWRKNGGCCGRSFISCLFSTFGGRMLRIMFCFMGWLKPYCRKPILQRVHLTLITNSYFKQCENHLHRKWISNQFYHWKGEHRCIVFKKSIVSTKMKYILGDAETSQSFWCGKKINMSHPLSDLDLECQRFFHQAKQHVESRKRVPSKYSTLLCQWRCSLHVGVCRRVLGCPRKLGTMVRINGL